MISLVDYSTWVEVISRKSVQFLMKMITQQIYPENMEQETDPTPIKDKINELTRSVSQVYKYELLTTNQYLQQMELVLEIFNELSIHLAEKNN